MKACFHTVCTLLGNCVGMYLLQKVHQQFEKYWLLRTIVYWQASQPPFTNVSSLCVSVSRAVLSTSQLQQALLLTRLWLMPVMSRASLWCTPTCGSSTTEHLNIFPSVLWTQLTVLLHWSQDLFLTLLILRPFLPSSCRSVEVTNALFCHTLTAFLTCDPNTAERE